MPRTKAAPKKRENPSISGSHGSRNEQGTAMGNPRKRVRQDVHDLEVDKNYVVLSTQGKRPSMEDSYDVFIDESEKYNIFSVYDGHGGYECAEFCKTHLNKLVYKNLVEYSMCSSSGSEVKESGDFSDAIRKAFCTVDDLYCKLCESDANRVDGSTATVVVHDLAKERLLTASVGDSRAILFQYGDLLTARPIGDRSSSNRIEVLNTIHLASDSGEAKRIVRSGGKIVSTNGLPRVEGVLMVSRAIGDSYLKKLVVSEPSLTTYEISEEGQNRIVLIGSDGLFDYMEDEELYTLFRPCNNLDELQSCVQRSVGTAISRGSNDNVTLVAIPLCEKLKNKKRSDSLCS